MFSLQQVPGQGRASLNALPVPPGQLGTTHSIDQHLPAVFLPLYRLLVDLGDNQLTSQQNVSNRQWNCAKLMLHGVFSCHQYSYFPVMIMMQMMRQLEFVTLGRCRGSIPNQHKWYRILLEIFCQENGAGQPEYIQHVEESIDGRAFWETASIYYPGPSLFQTASRWTTSLWDCRWIYVCNNWNLTAVESFREGWIELVAVCADPDEELCKQNLRDEETGKARQHAICDRFGWVRR